MSKKDAVSIPDIRKKRGRPATGLMPMLTFRAPPEIVAALEEAARRAPDRPNRSEMIRRIVTEWLEGEGLVEGEQ
ncbi:ribbon-helix-helix protein, CopG family [Salinarimonas sp.]|uniref:ribbon-helix-helix protein, CopG family n=1 Tax=Salinarimonas sp. TaxID=2766526 RepID=UPI00391CCB2D